MLTVSTDSPDAGHVTRRSFLQVGALGFGGLTLPRLLELQAAQGNADRPKTSVILLWMTGGPSHIDTYDMKPDETAAIRGPFQPIATNLPGLSVCDLMPLHAKIAERLTVIRSLHHKYGVHDDAQHLVQTGYPQLNARQRGQSHPCQGSVTSLLRGTNQPGMPAYVCVPEDYRSHMGFYQAPAFLNANHAAVNGGGDPKLGNYRPPEFFPPKEVSLTRLGNRRDLLQQMDGLRQRDDVRLSAMSNVQRQAFELITGPRARTAFDLSRESDSMKDRYGRHAWGQYTLLARRLVEAGVTFVTVNLYEKDVDWWDDHYTIEKNLRKRLPVYDRALSALIGDLRERGLLERTLVVACGEFGRAPRIDKNAGRGHWPRAMHAVLAGGGIRAGQIIGSTTRNGGEPGDDPYFPGDLLASIYRVLGINPQATITDRQNRPVRLVEVGKPIAKLFG